MVHHGRWPSDTRCRHVGLAPLTHFETVALFVDTHCHLDHHFADTPAEQVVRARAAGVTSMVTIGTDVASSRQAVDTASELPGVWAAVGIHPNDAGDATTEALSQLDELASREVVVAIGETGMDRYRDTATPVEQAAAFRAHIDIARAHDLTLVIHCREAWPDTLAVLADHGAPERVVMHCFSGDLDVVAHCAANGWFMSFAGNVTFRNAAPLRTAAAAAPVELLLTETDSPYLTPHPHRGEPNDPSMIPLVLAQLAEVHSRDQAEMAATVAANAARAFALPEMAGAHPRSKAS